MELLAAFALGTASGVWLTLLMFKPRPLEGENGPVTQVFTKPFSKRSKHTPKVNNDERAWKLENKREV